MHDDQFTATGPPKPQSGPGFPATGISTNQDAGFQFGLRVTAHRCGVVGQTEGGAVAGVYGHGRFSRFGVLGTAFGDAIGVVGTAVTTTNDLMNLNVPPQDVTLASMGDGSGVGVLGRSGSGDGVRAESRSGAGCHASSDTATGVWGSSRTGFGVHGSSGTGPGGFFASDGGAQVHLEPRDVIGSPEGIVAGSGGDVLATKAPGLPGPEFRLWFCTRSGDAGSARWALVAGSRPFPVQPPAPGSSGVDVRRIQARLNILTGTQLNGDGEYGPITRDAVAAFQEREGLPATGTADAITWDHLFALD